MERYESYLYTTIASIRNGLLEIPPELGYLYSRSGVYLLRADEVDLKFLTVCPEDRRKRLDDYLFESSSYPVLPLQAEIGADGTHYLKLPEKFLQYLELDKDGRAVIRHLVDHFTVSKKHHQEIFESPISNLIIDL